MHIIDIDNFHENHSGISIGTITKRAAKLIVLYGGP